MAKIFLRFSFISCFLVLSIQLHPAFAQSHWARTIGGEEDDWASAFELTNDGGLIIAGYTWSFGAGTADCWVLKLDSAGSVQWENTFGGSGVESCTAVQETADGYILAGQTTSFGEGLEDLWILKLDQQGNIQWQKTYGGSAHEDATSIRKTPDGGYIVGATTHSFGTIDYWLLKLDSGGNVEWQKTYGGAGSDQVPFVALTSDGGYIVLGTTDSLDAGDFLVIKLDFAGAIQWQKTYGGIGTFEFAQNVLETSNGSIILIGSGGTGDFLILKLDSTGSVLWQKTYGGNSSEHPYSVQETADGGYIVAGDTTSFGSVEGDFWLLKLNSDGLIQWQKTYGANTGNFSSEVATSIKQTLDGGYIVIGNTTSFGVGFTDIWVLRVDANGEIDPSCSLINDTSSTPINFSASITTTSFSSVDTSSIPASTSVTPAESFSMMIEQCANPCLFCDYFEDGTLADDWSYLKASWSEANGDLVGTPNGKSALAVATPVFSGCSLCFVESSILTMGTPFNKVWIFGWYIDKKNRVEVLMKQESNKFVIKQRVNGVIVAKTKAPTTILPNVFYDVKVAFDGTSFSLTVDGNLLTTLPAVGLPSGTVGFQVKNTTGKFGYILVD